MGSGVASSISTPENFGRHKMSAYTLRLRSSRVRLGRYLVRVLLSLVLERAL